MEIAESDNLETKESYTSSFRHPFMADQGALDLCCADAIPRNVENVIGAALEPEMTILVLGSHVTL